MPYIKFLYQDGSEVKPKKNRWDENVWPTASHYLTQFLVAPKTPHVLTPEAIRERWAGLDIVGITDGPINGFYATVRSQHCGDLDTMDLFGRMLPLADQVMPINMWAIVPNPENKPA